MPASRARPSATAQAHPGGKRSNGPATTDASAAPEEPSQRFQSGFPIVAVGASAGGLEACQRLFDAVGADTGMTFIVVLHLDPNHDSLMANLLSSHTAMPVVEAVASRRLEPDHVYVIAPGTYLTVAANGLVVAKPVTRHARLPFDVLLRSLAEAHGPRTIGVVLSGTGDDGSRGLQAVKAAGGACIAQDPEEAAFDGMPRAAISTGAVDRVLPLAKIPGALASLARGEASSADPANAPKAVESRRAVAAIIDFLREKTAHDFTTYKPGTLHRRIQRRMAVVGVSPESLHDYLELLKGDRAELDVLAKDLLIHVTSFFRDAKTFDYLERHVAPDMIRGRPAGEAVRIWVAGCSTGEEAYSIAMVYRAAIEAAGVDVKLQVFASDIDADAVTTARDGLYPDSIAGSVSPERLARFFTREEIGYRIAPELRACVVFTVQNLLDDPPFSRLDLVSCRNLLIYLRPEAQARIISIIHFALKEGGVLLLGGSESVGRADGRFESIAKPERLYRRIGRARRGEASFAIGGALFPRGPARASAGQAAARQASLAELCRRLVLEAHAPATVLINRARDCLYAMGPTDLYLRLPAGSPNSNLLAMARTGVRAKLASVITQAFERNAPIVVAGGPLGSGDGARLFQIEARPVQAGGETLLLLCFLDRPSPPRKADVPGDAADTARIAELENELELTRAELQSAVRSLEMASEEQTTINEEALSVNEEYQSTNEELITSKEELQSLNEELNALNSQLQETLDLQRTSANDLQNILYSTDMATLFLDQDLNIRFFTPATRALFNVIPGDVGRPLADLNSLAADADLMSDAVRMLGSREPLAREVQTRAGAWYLRRIMPYRAQGDAVEGVVITYDDITERKLTASSLEAATQAADAANRAKSRFLAAASHDLRQPLQTLSLIQGLLARKVTTEAERRLVRLQEQCLSAMSGMLNTLLDINQIDAGIIEPEKTVFPIDGLFDRLRDEFAYHAQAKGLRLHIAPCSLSIVSDPALLEQMVRNLLANAVKYTAKGKILVGCRRRGEQLQIQVLDTGVGIAPDELKLIFEEYHQVENVARERSRGLGLGLSIVERLGGLLGHSVTVRSRAKRGSVFTIDVERAPTPSVPPQTAVATQDAAPSIGHARLTGAVLIVEDDPEVRDLLSMMLADEGHAVTAAADGATALDLIDRMPARPQIILADYNLPGGMNGVELAMALRGRIGSENDVVILTGDISTESLRDVANQNGVPLHKPVKPEILSGTIQNLLAARQAAAMRPSARDPARAAQGVIAVVDDDAAVREALAAVLEAEGFGVQTHRDCESFLAAHRPGLHACLLIDAYLPGGMNGLELIRRLRATGDKLPAIMITGEADVRIAVQAMKAGAADFIEKPVTGAGLIESVARVLEMSRDHARYAAARAAAAVQIGALTRRQRQILDRVLAGEPSKNIAADLGISQRTVENHRAAIMHRTGSKSLPALARLALAAEDDPPG
jgi:two-component system CheB/CheR fusion protein